MQCLGVSLSASKAFGCNAQEYSFPTHRLENIGKWDHLLSQYFAHLSNTHWVIGYLQDHVLEAEVLVLCEKIMQEHVAILRQGCSCCCENHMRCVTRDDMNRKAHRWDSQNVPLRIESKKVLL